MKSGFKRMFRAGRSAEAKSLDEMGIFVLSILLVVILVFLFLILLPQYSDIARNSFYFLVPSVLLWNMIRWQKRKKKQLEPLLSIVKGTIKSTLFGTCLKGVCEERQVRVELGTGYGAAANDKRSFPTISIYMESDFDVCLTGRDDSA